jgi:RNA polymerase-binding transcription factor DksA
MMTIVDVQAQRDRLEAERRALESTLAQPRDGDESFDRRAIATQLATTLEAVEAALGRIDEGTYGRCVACGAAIPAERLLAVPEAGQCVPCQGGSSR